MKNITTAPDELQAQNEELIRQNRELQKKLEQEGAL